MLSNPVLGKSWEGLVIENIISILPNNVESYFYRTSGGAEIDLILKMSSKELWAIEIKHGVAPKIRPNFHQASEDIKATQKFVVYGGDDEFPIEKNTTVISLPRLMEKLLDL